ncbi:hypothetical protein [Hubei narna-like virus 19]|uniref:hypothetical protein n=1 Tax=Hubei narna-like virus 19 TaxID=1922949 RepID=UPI000909A260|nr:hypothetical protein [Hubei narna-like virus 19]APG77153.1 hypothetical protein [Hubei narna-like virus 19]
MSGAMPKHCEVRKVTLAALCRPLVCTSSGRLGVWDVRSGHRSDPVRKSGRVRIRSWDPPRLYPGQCHEPRAPLAEADGATRTVSMSEVTPITASSLIELGLLRFGGPDGLGPLLAEVFLRENIHETTGDAVRSCDETCQLDSCLMMTGRVTYSGPNRERYTIQPHPAFSIWQTGSTQIQREMWWNSSGEPNHKVTVIQPYGSVRLAALARYYIRSLGEPSSQGLNQGALTGSRTNYASNRKVLKDLHAGYYINWDELTQGSLQGVGKLLCSETVRETHCPLGKSAAGARNDSFRPVYGEAHLLHDIEVNFRPWEDPEEVIPSDNMRVRTISSFLHAKSVEKGKGEEAERSAHMNTAGTRDDGTIRITELHRAKHDSAVRINVRHNMMWLEESGPERLRINVGNVVCCIGKVTANADTVPVERRPNGAKKLNIIGLSIHVGPRLIRHHCPHLSSYYITNDEGSSGELCKNPRFISFFRDRHHVGNPLLLWRDGTSCHIDSVVKGFRDPRVEIALRKRFHTFEIALRFCIADQLLHTSSFEDRCSLRRGVLIRCPRNFLFKEVGIISRELPGPIVNVVGQFHVDITWRSCDDRSVCLYGLGLDKCIPFRETSANARNLRPSLGVAHVPGQPFLEGTRHVTLRSGSSTSHRPLAVLEAELLQLLGYVVPTPRVTRTAEEPTCEYLCRDDISKLLVVSKYNIGHNSFPDRVRISNSIPIRQGRHWQLMPMSCPNNTRGNRPRQYVRW